MTTPSTPRKFDLAAEISLRPLPVLTLLAIIVPFIFLLWLQSNPAVLTALQRDPRALANGEWWRLLSPLLVDSDGWLQFITVSIGFVCVGIAAEHRLGGGRWLLLFFTGALAGELAGYAWQPYGGGGSIALFGLMAGLAVFMLRRGQPVLFLPGVFTVFEITALLSTDIPGKWFSIILFAGMAVAWGVLLSTGRLRALVWLVNGACLLGALLLLGLRDMHGAALLAGLAVGALLAWRDPKFQPA